MADTISRIYLDAYETNKKAGKVFLVVFLLIFVLPFVVAQVSSMTSWMGAVSSERPARMLGITNMHNIGNDFRAVKADRATLPVLGDRPSRMKGVVNMQTTQVVVERPAAPKAVPETMPSRARGVWNMRMGGIL